MYRLPLSRRLERFNVEQLTFSKKVAMISWHSPLSWNNLRSSILGPSESRCFQTAGVCFATNTVPTGQFTPFERQAVSTISDAPGIYCFHVGHARTCLPPLGLSLYGGISEDSLRRRCMRYFSEKDAKEGRLSVRRFLHVFEGELTLVWSEIDTTAFDIKRMERDFNDAMMPPYSRRDFSAELRAARGAWQ